MTVQLSLQIQTDLTGLLGAQNSDDFAVDKAQLIQQINTELVTADAPTADILNALKAQTRTWNYIPAPLPGSSTDQQLLQRMLADAAQNIPVDLGALMSLIVKITAEQRKARLEDMQAQQGQKVDMALASKDSADKAAGERFTASLASGIGEIASGAVQMGVGAYGLKKTFNAGRSQLASAAKEAEVQGLQQTQDGFAHTLKVHSNKIKTLQEELRDAPQAARPQIRHALAQARQDHLAHLQLMKNHENTVVQPARAEVKTLAASSDTDLRLVDAFGRVGQGVSSSAASCGSVTEAFYNQDAALDDNESKLRDALGDAAGTAAQVEHDFMSSAKDTADACINAMKSYNEAMTQTGANVAGRFA